MRSHIGQFVLRLRCFAAAVRDQRGGTTGCGGCVARAGQIGLRGLDITLFMVTHDLPYALELCPRSVVLSEGVVVADGPTRDILLNDELMRANRLELPFGFDPRNVPA